MIFLCSNSWLNKETFDWALIIYVYIYFFNKRFLDDMLGQL